MSDYWPEKRFFMSGIKGLIGRFLSVTAFWMLISANNKIITLLKTIAYEICWFFLRRSPKVLVCAVVNRDSTNSFYESLKPRRNRQKTVVYGIQQENFNYFLNWIDHNAANIDVKLLRCNIKITP
ncbi:hypothetical protein [Methylophilus sp. QUAN]|uniref:hypothetical protein n=1 Tax=Methylophilus sp. QUAN TaxID=2781020 RepID=UPI00188E6A65|nr:hypothetical protein [Methylophilus sp. QUAN]MBF4991171.1 hypothetical protein [Methylophilus sp. QUAN]